MVERSEASASVFGAASVAAVVVDDAFAAATLLRLPPLSLSHTQIIAPRQKSFSLSAESSGGGGSATVRHFSSSPTHCQR